MLFPTCEAKPCADEHLLLYSRVSLLQYFETHNGGIYGRHGQTEERCTRTERC